MPGLRPGAGAGGECESELKVLCSRIVVSALLPLPGLTESPLKFLPAASALGAVSFGLGFTLGLGLAPPVFPLKFNGGSCGPLAPFPICCVGGGPFPGCCIGGLGAGCTPFKR